MTPQDRQCINELLEAACISGATLEVAAQSICEELLHLTAAELAETCSLHTEELHLNLSPGPTRMVTVRMAAAPIAARI